MIGGFSFSPVPDDPFDSGSGGGSGDEGDYVAKITVGHVGRRLLRRTAEVRRRARWRDPGRLARHHGDQARWRPGHRLDPGRIVHLPSGLAVAGRRQRHVRLRRGEARLVQGLHRCGHRSTTTSCSRSTGPARSRRRRRRSRRSSSTSTASGSTPPCGAAPGSGPCHRSPRSLDCGAHQGRPQRGDQPGHRDGEGEHPQGPQAARVSTTGSGSRSGTRATTETRSAAGTCPA